MAVPARTRTLAKILFAVALVGILVVTHLSLQIDKGFADGCAGLGATISADAMGASPEAACASVATGEYKDFLGLSNILWGLGFYIVVALLRLGYGVTGDDRTRKAAFGIVALGFLYTLRLVYLQAFVIGSFCILCMLSALTVTTLLILHILEHRQLGVGARHSAPPPSQSAALRPYLAVAGVFALFLAADVVIAGGGAEAPEVGSETASGDGTTTQPVADNSQPLEAPVPAGCTYAPEFGPIGDVSAWLDNPKKGSGPVQVIEIFDPNCPHCRDLHNAIKPVIAARGDDATFYAVAFPLKQPTVLQAVALKLAEREGKFFELQEEFFARQDASWGMTPDEIRDASNKVGLDGPSIIATMEDQDVIKGILADIQIDATAVQEWLAAPGGGLSVPKLIIGGRVIAGTNESYSERCLNEFITQAGAPSDAPAAVVSEVE